MLILFFVGIRARGGGEDFLRQEQQKKKGHEDGRGGGGGGGGGARGGGGDRRTGKTKEGRREGGRVSKCARKGSRRGKDSRWWERCVMGKGGQAGGELGRQADQRGQAAVGWASAGGWRWGTPVLQRAEGCAQWKCWLNVKKKPRN